MDIPPDDVERIERQRIQNRWMNVAWLIFIFSPLLIIWSPSAIANFQSTVQFLINLFR